MPLQVETSEFDAVLDELTDNGEAATSQALLQLEELLKNMLVANDMSPVLKFLSSVGNDSILRYRVFECAVKLFLRDDIKHNIMLRSRLELSGLFEGLVFDCFNSLDLLSQANSFEIVTHLVSDPAGVVYLNSVHFFERTNDLFQNPSSDGMLLPILLKFIANLAKVDPETVLTIFHASLNGKMVSIIQDIRNDETLLCLTIEVYCSILYHRKEYFNRIPHLSTCIAFIWRLVREHPVIPVRVKALDSLIVLVGYTPDEFDTAESIHLRETITLKLFTAFDSGIITSSSQNTIRAFNTLIAIARQPIPELKAPALGVIEAVSSQHWALRMVCETPGFLEYLLDRRTELNKTGLEIKYSIVHNLCSNQHATEILQPPQFLALKKYISDGVFYAAAPNFAVAYDGV